MLAFLIISMSGIVSLASVYFAFREQSQVNRELADIRKGIDAHTGEVVTQSSIDEELDDLLRDVFQESHHATMVLAMNELSSSANLARERSRALARGMSRIPFLSGGAGALALIALGRLEGSSLVQAGTCLGVGFLGSLVAQFFAKRAHRSAKALVNVVETLSRMVEKRWKQTLLAGPSSVLGVT